MFDLVVEAEDVSDEQKARIFKKLGEADKVTLLFKLKINSISALCNYFVHYKSDNSQNLLEILSQ